MRARNRFVVAASAGALALAGAAPAWAHAEFQNQSVPANTHTELTLNVPVERPASENSRIEITLPDAFDSHSCTADEGWSCTVDNDKDPEHPGLPQVTFTRVHCARESSYKCSMEEPAKPDAAVGVAQPATAAGFAHVQHEAGGGGHDEGGSGEGGGAPGQAFRFLVHTPAKAGAYHVKVVQRYNTGEIVKWDGEEGSKTPAPMLKVS